MTNQQFILNFFANPFAPKNKQHQNLLSTPSVLYSYGHHFPLAIALPSTDSRPVTFLLNSKSYSNTTSKHQSYTRYSTPEGALVLFWDFGPSLRSSFGANPPIATLISDLEAHILYVTTLRNDLSYKSMAKKTRMPLKAIARLEAKIATLQSHLLTLKS